MARVTVEDCVTKIPNRFELVMLASQRARDISAGAKPTIDRDDDKNPVVALREIADGNATREALAESLVRSMQRHVEIDEPDDTPLSLPVAEDGGQEGDSDATALEAEATEADSSEAAPEIEAPADDAADAQPAVETPSEGDAPAAEQDSNVIDFAERRAAMGAKPADAPGDGDDRS